MKFFVFFGLAVLAISAVTDVAAEKKLSNVLDEIIDVVNVDDVRSVLRHALLDGKRGFVLRDAVNNEGILNFVLNVIRELDISKDLVKVIEDSKIYEFVISVWKGEGRSNDFNRNIAADLLINESKILKVLADNIDNSSELRNLLLRLRSRHNRNILRKYLRSDYGHLLRNYVSNNYLLDNIVNKLRFLFI